MTQDFARRARKSSASKSSSKAKPKRNTRKAPARNTKKAPAWAWLVIGSLLAALITLLIYLANQPEEGAAPVQAKVKTEVKKPPQPRFDFYEILKEQEIEVPDRSGEIRAAIPDDIDYYLQAGSFRNRSDAENLRAELILMNMPANVETSTNASGTTWHRVIAGPFGNRSKMAKGRSALASMGINPLVLKRKTD